MAISSGVNWPAFSFLQSTNNHKNQNTIALSPTRYGNFPPLMFSNWQAVSHSLDEFHLAGHFLSMCRGEMAVVAGATFEKIKSRKRNIRMLMSGECARTVSCSRREDEWRPRHPEPAKIVAMFMRFPS